MMVEEDVPVNKSKNKRTKCAKCQKTKDATMHKVSLPSMSAMLHRYTRALNQAAYLPTDMICGSCRREVMNYLKRVKKLSWEEMIEPQVVTNANPQMQIAQNAPDNGQVEEIGQDEVIRQEQEAVEEGNDGQDAVRNNEELNEQQENNGLGIEGQDNGVQNPRPNAENGSTVREDDASSAVRATVSIGVQVNLVNPPEEQPGTSAQMRKAFIQKRKRSEDDYERRDPMTLVQAQYSEGSSIDSQATSNSEPLPQTKRKKPAPTLLIEGVLGFSRSQSSCCVKSNCDTPPTRKVVPESAVYDLMVSKRVWLSGEPRACKGHFDLDKGVFKEEAKIALARLATPGVKVSGKDILHLFNRIAERSPENIIDVERLTNDEDFKRLMAVTSVQFNIIYATIEPYLRDSVNRSAPNTLAMFLVKLRLNLSQSMIGFLFGLSQKKVSETMARVSFLLDKHFTPRYLGYKHITREQILQDHTTDYIRALYNLLPTNIALYMDATYLYIQKSKNHVLQKRTFSLQKLRNLLKIMMVVLATGYIIDVHGMYYADYFNNDARILMKMIRDNSRGIVDFLAQGDTFILDRGFRDSVFLAEQHGYKVNMPHCLQDIGKELAKAAEEAEVATLGDQLNPNVIVEPLVSRDDEPTPGCSKSMKAVGGQKKGKRQSPALKANPSTNVQPEKTSRTTKGKTTKIISCASKLGDVVIPKRKSKSNTADILPPPSSKATRQGRSTRRINSLTPQKVSAENSKTFVESEAGSIVPLRRSARRTQMEIATKEASQIPCSVKPSTSGDLVVAHVPKPKETGQTSKMGTAKQVKSKPAKKSVENGPEQPKTTKRRGRRKVVADCNKAETKGKRSTVKRAKVAVKKAKAVVTKKIKAKTPKQFTTEQANESRLVTMTRWVVEGVNGRIKEVWPFFAGVIPCKYYVHDCDHKLTSYFRFACATSNAFFPPLYHETEKHRKLIEEVRKRIGTPNTLQADVKRSKWNTKRVDWVDPDNEPVPDFPVLTKEDLWLVTLGHFQLNNAQEYVNDHFATHSIYKIQVHKQKEGYLRAKLTSKYRSKTKHNVYIDFSKGKDHIRHYCTCKVGARTLGCCSHIASVLWYYGFRRHQYPSFRPTVLGDDILDAAEKRAAEGVDCISDSDEDEEGLLNGEKQVAQQ